MRSWLQNVAVVLIGAGFVVGCASNPDLKRWASDVLRAERKLQHGKYEEALADFTALEKAAHFYTDAVEMRLRQAEVYRRSQQYEDALGIMATLIRERAWVDREQHAKILYLKGRLLDDAGLSKRADALLTRVLNRFPKTAYGWRSWVFLKPRLMSQLSFDEFIEYCRAMFHRHRNTPIADNFIYEAANRYFKLDTPQANKRALQLYEQFLEIWIMETSGFWDDVVWELSTVYHRLGRYRDEEQVLLKLLSMREPGWPSPTDLKNYKYAYMRIAKLYMFEFKQPERAADLFREYEESFPKSIFRDDMLWWEGHAWLRAGDKTKAQSAWKRLVRLYPDSKYRRRIQSGYPAPTVETPIP